MLLPPTGAGTDFGALLDHVRGRVFELAKTQFGSHVVRELIDFGHGLRLAVHEKRTGGRKYKKRAGQENKKHHNTYDMYKRNAS